MSSRDLGRLVLPALFRRIEFPGHLGRIGLLGHLGRIKLPAHLRRKKNCRGPGGHPVHVPGRFEAAASPSCCALGDARRGSKVAQKGQLPRRWWWIDAPCPSPKPEASDTPVGALGTALYTYQDGFVQPPPRRLCPGRCTRRVKSDGKKKANYSAFNAGSTLRPPRRRPEASDTPAGALGTTL